MPSPVLLLAIIVLFLVNGFGGLAYAATFNVTKTADTDDGACDVDCSLREATAAANLAPGSTVIVPAGVYALSIAGANEDANATGDLDIAASMTILGAGVGSTIVDGGALDRVIHVLAGTVSISDLTIRNGSAPDSYGDGGGISSAGTLTTLALTNVAVSGNKAAYGGGISNPGGTAIIDRVTVSGNTASGAYSDSAQGQGGGVYNTGTMTLNRSTVSGNTAGGLYWFQPGGGGIYNQIGSLTLTRSTVSGNTAGAGIVNLNATLTVENSTISDNTSTTGFGGGGILNFSGFGGYATTTVISSTIAENRNTAGRGDAIADRISFPGSLTVRNSIFASPMTGHGSDCYLAGAPTSGGHNIAADEWCDLSGTGDLESINPMLGPLAANGGPTRTHVPLTGSPAINGVPVASCTVSTDQRGAVRPQGAACDIGSVEVLLAPTGKDQCRNGGWALFTVPRAFANQGDCIRFVSTGK